MRERSVQDRKEGYRRREEYGGGVGLAIVAALEKKNAAVKIATMNAAPPLMISSRSVARLLFVDDEKEDEEVGMPSKNVGRGSFLSSCFLCKKKLHGIDIYMYRYSATIDLSLYTCVHILIPLLSRMSRGEKAFCSIECRWQEMTAEQLQEKCSD